MRKHTELSDIDQLIRHNLAVGMETGTKLHIEYICGFELFGSYETWSEGYEVTGPVGPVGPGWIKSETITVRGKYLDETLLKFFSLQEEKEKEFKANTVLREGKSIWEI